jgi:RHS repeat-associated protein
MTTNVASDVRYYGYRYSALSTGRFLSIDPHVERSPTEPYTLCGNRTVDNIDPYGLEWRVKTSITNRDAGFRRRGATRIDKLDFTYRAGPTPSCRNGCCKLDILDVGLWMTVHLPENASSTTILHEFDHVYDYAIKLHNSGKTYLQGYSRCYKSCDVANCVVKALAHALAMLKADAIAYTVRNVDYPDAYFWQKGKYESQYWSSIVDARELRRQFSDTLYECDDALRGDYRLDDE